MAAAVAGLAAAACSDTSPSRAAVAPDGRSSRRWATGAALLALGPDGAFDVPPHVPGPGEIDPAQATALGEAFARTFGGSLRSTWEQDRGAPIKIEGLQACAPAVYARARYAPSAAGVGASGLPAFIQRALGARYLVELCDGGTPAVSVAIVAAAIEARVVGGRLDHAHGPDFLAVGIPTAVTRSLVRPEDAALFATQVTGRRIAAVPELVLPPYPQAPQLARWHVTLDAAVPMRGRNSGALRPTLDLEVGAGDTWRTLELRSGDPRIQVGTLRVPVGANGTMAPMGPNAKTVGAVVVALSTAAQYAPTLESVEVAR